MPKRVANGLKLRFLSPFFGSQSKYRRKLLGGFLLVSVVLFFVFSLLILHAADRQYRAEINQVGRQTITQARNTSDTLLMDIFSYGLQSVSHDTELAYWMYKEEAFNINDAVLANNIMSDLQKISSYVDNVYVFNFSNQRILTKTGIFQFGAFYDQELLDLVTAFQPSAIPMRYTPRTATIHSGVGQNSQAKVWTLVFRWGFGGALVLDINYEDYVSLLNIQTESEYVESWIINEKGLVLVGSEDAQFGADMTDSPLLKAVQSQPFKEGSFTYQDPQTHKDSVVYYIQNAYLGFTYISTVQSTPFGTGNKLFLTIFAWSVLFLTLSAIGSVLLTGFMYRPVKELSEELELSAPTEEKTEFDIFREAYEAIRESNHKLLSSAQAWHSMEEQKMLLKWIDPDAVNRRYNPKQYEKIEGYFQNLYYNCVLFNIDSSESGSTSEDMGLLKYSITNMIEELAAGHFLLRWVDYSAKQIVYICNFGDDDRTALKQALDTIQNVLTEHFKTVATVAVGVTVDDTDDLPQSLQSAKQALDRRFSYGVGTVTFCDEAVLVSTENARYPQEQESQLLSAIRSGDLEETHRQLAAFFECIRPYRMESILMCLLQLDLSFQKLEGANHLDRQSLDLTQVYTSAMTLDQLSGQFEFRAKTVVDLIQSIRENNTDKLISRVNKLVLENLCDPSLSAAWLADKVDLSVNYLRNIYKESTGESLSAHISQAKLDLICEMLLTSDLSIQEISEKLQFTTHNYFFTFFKKHMGVTPKQYRLAHGNNKD